jgi:Undecaprenyl-phosphate glucose phosphotransferase
VTPVEPEEKRRFLDHFTPSALLSVARIADPLVVALLGYGIFLAYHPWALLNYEYLVTVCIAAVLTRILCDRFGAYEEGRLYRGGFGTQPFVLGFLASAGVLLGIAFALKISEDFSRLWFGTWVLSTIVVLVGGRLWISYLVKQAVDEGRFGLRSVIVGTGRQGRLLADHLTFSRDQRLRVLGFFDERAPSAALPDDGPQYLGDLDRLMAMIRRREVDQVFVALPWTDDERIRDIALSLSDLPVHVCLAPDLVAYQFAGSPAVTISGLPMVRLFDRPLSDGDYIAKRLEDLFVSLIALALTGPFMLLIALAIRLESPGPIFFRQIRQGFNNEPIEVWKFRSMYHEARDAAGERQATAGDARVTRVGNLLRRSSLDEMPQFFNVLRGEMSVVGPRPHALGTKAEGALFVEVVQRYAARHRVKPGITGWAQVSGWRGETDTTEKIRKRVECDLFYIENWSLWFDFWIMLRTLPLMFWDRRAY